ncbi:MAG: hypothetical protein LBP89_07885, partial [Helicobacteraceae bacterium]|nr:hypothetical protein [Helicobacteraceae bacterium]
MISTSTKALLLAMALTLPIQAQDEGSTLQTTTDQTPIADQTQSSVSTINRESNETDRASADEALKL